MEVERKVRVERVVRTDVRRGGEGNPCEVDRGLIRHCKHVEPSGQRNGAVVMKNTIMAGVTSRSFAEISQNIIGSLRRVDILSGVDVVDRKQM